MSILKKFFRSAHLVAEYGAISSFAGMIVSVTIQVYARFFLESAPHWTEEMSRFFFVYIIAFGIGSAVRKDAMVKLDIWAEHSHTKWHRTLNIVFNISIAFFAIWLTILSWQFAQSGSFEKSASLGISMTVAFASLVLMSGSIALFSIEKSLIAMFDDFETQENER